MIGGPPQDLSVIKCPLGPFILSVCCLHLLFAYFYRTHTCFLFIACLPFYYHRHLEDLHSLPPCTCSASLHMQPPLPPDIPTTLTIPPPHIPLCLPVPTSLSPLLPLPTPHFSWPCLSNATVALLINHSHVHYLQHVGGGTSSTTHNTSFSYHVLWNHLSL